MTTNAIRFVNAKTMRCFTVTRDNTDFMAKRLLAMSERVARCFDSWYDRQRHDVKLNEFDVFTGELFKQPDLLGSPILSLGSRHHRALGQGVASDDLRSSYRRVSRRAFSGDGPAQVGRGLYAYVVNEILHLMTEEALEDSASSFTSTRRARGSSG